MTPTTPAVAGRPTAGLEEAGARLAKALSDCIGKMDEAQRRVPSRILANHLRGVAARATAALAAWHAALEAHRAAQRQAADDDEAAFRVNEDRGAVE